MQKGFQSVNFHGDGNGVIATPVIGENGNWWIGNDDTGVKAGTTSDLDQRLADLEAKYELMNSNLTPVVLWTNQAPTSNFAAQTIKLSTSDYNVIMVRFKISAGSSFHKSAWAKKGDGIVLDIATGGPGGVQALSRTMVFSDDTTCILSDATLFGSDKGMTNNAYCVPVQIVGLK